MLAVHKDVDVCSAMTRLVPPPPPDIWALFRTGSKEDAETKERIKLIFATVQDRAKHPVVSKIGVDY